MSDRAVASLRLVKPLVAMLIEARAAEHPDRVFLKMAGGVRQTWRAFHDDCLRIAHGLRDAGCRPGDRVAIMLPNCREFLPVYFGASFAGCTPVPLNTSQRGDTLRHVLTDASPAAIVIDAGLWPFYDAVRDGLGLREIVRGTPPDGALVALADILAGPASPVPDPDGDAPSFGILYTSGTTGPPKGVVPTRSDIAPLLAIWQAMNVAAGETIYTPLPLFHGNPLAISVVGAMFMDASIGIGERFSASRFWDEVREFDAVEFNHVGAVIPILLKQPPRPGDAANPVRTVLSAGCPPDAWEPFERRFGVRIVEQFSMVDSPGYLINSDGPRGSMGKPVAACEAAIIDTAGAPITTPGAVGELVLRAAEGRTHSYLNQHDATEEAYRGGWFHTGDLASRDANGWFFYAGRLKESMRRRGENVSAWEVENVVNAHPAVLESAAHAVPSPVGEDDIKVVVVLQPGATLDPSELVAFCTPRMAAHAVPRYVEIVDEIPKTPTQRPRYADLKARGVTPQTWDRG